MKRHIATGSLIAFLTIAASLAGNGQAHAAPLMAVQSVLSPVTDTLLSPITGSDASQQGNQSSTTSNPGSSSSPTTTGSTDSQDQAAATQPSSSQPSSSSSTSNQAAGRSNSGTSRSSATGTNSTRTSAAASAATASAQAQTVADNTDYQSRQISDASAEILYRMAGLMAIGGFVVYAATSLSRKPSKQMKKVAAVR